MTSARFAMDSTRGRRMPSFTFCPQCLDFVLPSVYVIACSKVDDYDNCFLRLFPVVWPWTLEGILRYFKKT